MPYIPEGEREMIGDHATRLGNYLHTSGQLNFVITKTILAYLGDDPHYHDFNNAIGVLECVKQELYRRMIGPYEDQKCEENGDVGYAGD